MVRLFIFLTAAWLALLVLGTISALAAERVRTLPRALWALLIFVIPLAGPIAYYVWGRPRSPVPAGAVAHRPARRVASPDDDPDFLRAVDPEQSRRDRELLAQWEKDFRDDDS